jgi:hypothetical protein
MTAHGAVGRIQQLLIACHVSFPIAIPTCCLCPLAKIMSGKAETSRAKAGGTA